MLLTLKCANPLVDSDLTGLRQGLRSCVSNMGPGAAVSQPTFSSNVLTEVEGTVYLVPDTQAGGWTLTSLFPTCGQVFYQPQGRSSGIKTEAPGSTVLWVNQWLD